MVDVVPMDLALHLMSVHAQRGGKAMIVTSQSAQKNVTMVVHALLQKHASALLSGQEGLAQSLDVLA